MALTQVKTLGIADDAVTGAKIADDTVAEANMANDAIGLAEIKAGTDGQILTFDASGNPAYVGPGTDGQVLTSTGAGSPPAFEAVPATGATINNATANELVTVASTTTQLDAESSLTFDGSTLKVFGTEGSNANVQLIADEGDDNADYWLTQATTDGKYRVLNYADSGWESNIICNGSGNVELYYDNTKKFETTSAGATVTGGLTLTGGLSMQANQYMHGSSGIDFYGDGSDAASKLVQIVDGNVKFKDGHGIDFSLTANEDSSGSNITGSGTPELLDFYEEGEWDPAPWLWNGSAWVAGGLDAAASTQVGYYTRIGRVCYIGGRVAGFNGDGNFDDKYMAVGPLPFSGAAGDSGGLTGYVKGVATTTTTAFFPSSNYAFSRRIGDMDGSHNAWGGSGTGTATELQLFGFYMIA